MAGTQNSKLIPVGILLIVLSFAAAPVARLIPGPMTPLLALLLDGLRLGFFVGLALLIIGALRQRKARRHTPQNPS
jgi:hypothetical protein